MDETYKKTQETCKRIQKRPTKDQRDPLLWVSFVFFCMSLVKTAKGNSKKTSKETHKRKQTYTRELMDGTYKKTDTRDTQKKTKETHKRDLQKKTTKGN